MNHKLSLKIDGKWRTVASIKTNQWGNLNVGINKEVMREALMGEGWTNLSVFEEKDEEAKPEPKATTVSDDEIPFN